MNYGCGDMVGLCGEGIVEQSLAFGLRQKGSGLKEVTVGRIAAFRVPT